MNKLLFCFENELDIEAERLASLFLQMNSTNKPVNTNISSLIKKNIKKEYLPYSIDVEMKIISYIPKHLTYDNTGKFIFVSKNSATENYIRNYSHNYFIDAEKLSYTIAKSIINDYQNNNISNVGLFEMLSYYMQVYKEDYEVMDFKSILLYFQKSLEKLGYDIVEINPFKLVRKNKKSRV